MAYDGIVGVVGMTDVPYEETTQDVSLCTVRHSQDKSICVDHNLFFSLCLTIALACIET